MHKADSKKLLENYIAGDCSAYERALVESWYLTYQEDKDVPPLDELEQVAALNLTWQNLQQHISKGKKARRLQFIRWSAAAALLVFFGAGLLFIGKHVIKNDNGDNRPIAIVAGGNKAVLTLADGKAINLSSDKEGLIIKTGELTYNDGTKIYDFNEIENSATLNTVSTPKGGQYQVILADGTKVWLNAASTLRYPSRFNENERIVELEGEAYFEVEKETTWAKGKKQSTNKPFKVRSKGQEIVVTGTAFNVSAYQDDHIIKTTLITGGVEIFIHQGNPTESTQRTNGTVLIPGQEAIVSSEGVEKRDADVYSALAWKRGVFKFWESELHDVMRQLSRWYDIEVDYAVGIPETYFYGEIGRNESLDAVISILKNSGLNFRIQQKGEINKLIVFP